MKIFNGIDVPTNVAEAIRTVPMQSWEEFFKTLRRVQTDQLEGTPDSDLVLLKAKTQYISEVENYFREIKK